MGLIIKGTIPRGTHHFPYDSDHWPESLSLKNMHKSSNRSSRIPRIWVKRTACLKPSSRYAYTYGWDIIVWKKMLDTNMDELYIIFCSLNSCQCPFVGTSLPVPNKVETSYWLVVSTHLKNIRQNGFIFPNFRGEHKKCLSCHHLG